MVKRTTCDESWESDGKTVHCQRWAIITVDVNWRKTKAYCEEHAPTEADVSEYR